jgi:hypothetical protein
MANAAPLRIVAIGDSITQGRGDHANSSAKRTPTYGWRYAFWKKCIDAGIDCQMAGSMSTGFESTPDYPDYQGKKFANCHEARAAIPIRAATPRLPGISSLHWKHCCEFVTNLD